MQIIYKRTAIDDLLNIESYIISQFNNKQAAQKLKSTIVNVERQILHKSQLHFKLQSEYIVDRV